MGMIERVISMLANVSDRLDEAQRRRKESSDEDASKPERGEGGSEDRES